VLRTALRYCPALVDEFSKCIAADLGSEALESAPMNAGSIRSDVSRLVLWALIAMSFCSTAARRGGWVDRSADIVGDCFLLVGEKVHEALARLSRTRNALSQ
jgi:hypothetical protein